MTFIQDVVALYLGNQPADRAYLGDRQVWPASPPNNSGGELPLPREPWHGGSAYYDQFPMAANRGWSDPSFFPFVMFPNGFIDDGEVAWDSQTASVYHDATEWCYWPGIETHNMSYIGWQVEAHDWLGGTMPANYGPWVGHSIQDEIDGVHENPQDGLDAIASQMTALPQDDGRFVFANYTQRVMDAGWSRPGGGTWGENFVNYPGVDVVCIDMYWYTVPDTSYWANYVTGGDTVKGPGARRAGSYGASIRALRWLDAQDNHLKPIWMYIENLSGSPGEQFVRYIEPDELKAAVMSCITNGASGIVWFNNVASATHYAANVSRVAQTQPGHPAVSRVQAAKEIKEFVESLAPVINSQSYIWDFGASTIDTMLKTHNDYAYIFAVPGTGGGAGPTLGTKTFQLPPGVMGNIEVVGESRTIVPTGNAFTDTFPNEYTWHVYRIAVDPEAGVTPAPTIFTASLGVMTVGSPYTLTMSVTGTAPITWSVTAGSLPAGIALSSSGVISGTPTIADSYDVTIQATNAAGSVSRQYAGSVSIPVPVLSYGFNEGTGDSFAPTHGIAVGSGNALQWTTGRSGFGNALNRTEAGSHQTGVLASMPISGVESWMAITVAFWYRPRTTNEEVPFAIWHNTGDWMGIQVNNGNSIVGWFDSDISSAADSLSVGTWAHIACVWNGSAFLVYVDGSEVINAPTTQTPSAIQRITLNGADWAQNGGSIDDFRIYNTALTEEQINEIKDVPL